MIKKGFLAMLPTTTGVIPFGLVMGSVASSAGLGFSQTLFMNISIFAGASQLAAVELMSRDAPIFIVVLTGMVINLRFMLYSASIAGLLKERGVLLKMLISYSLTDQSYAVLMANFDRLSERSEKVLFYIGTIICMIIAWQLSVVLGYMFGNFAPKSWALDFAVPLSFIALVLPSLKSKTYYYVAIFSSALSLLLKDLPLNLGLLVTAMISIGLATFFVFRDRRGEK